MYLTKSRTLSSFTFNIFPVVHLNTYQNNSKRLKVKHFTFILGAKNEPSQNNVLSFVIIFFVVIIEKGDIDGVYCKKTVI